MSDERRRVPQVQAVAVVGAHALIGGFPAYFLSRLLVNLPGGLTAQLGRYGLSAEHHADVLRAVDGLRHAGAAWQLAYAREAASRTGSDFEAEPNSRIRSGSNGLLPVLSAEDAALVLGVSSRWVRALAEKGSLRGHRTGGRWCFAPDDVAAAREQRSVNGVA